MSDLDRLEAAVKEYLVEMAVYKGLLQGTPTEKQVDARIQGYKDVLRLINIIRETSDE